MSSGKQTKQTEADKLKSLLVIVLGFLLLYILFGSRTFLYISAVVGVASLMSSHAKNGILWLWDKIALVLGWINTRILLGIVFYLFLFPIAVIFRLSTKNPLQLKNDEESIYGTRNHKYTRDDLENIW